MENMDKKSWAASKLDVSKYCRLKEAEQSFKRKLKTAIHQADQKQIMLLFCARDIMRGIQ